MNLRVGIGVGGIIKVDQLYNWSFSIFVELDFETMPCSLANKVREARF